jgi:hypothetical protein
VAVADEIDALATRAKKDLDDLFNFGAHIHLVDDVTAAAKRRLSKPASA